LVITPNPNTANPNTAFGFDEEKTEFPEYNMSDTDKNLAEILNTDYVPVVREENNKCYYS